MHTANNNVAYQSRPVERTGVSSGHSGGRAGVAASVAPHSPSLKSHSASGSGHASQSSSHAGSARSSIELDHISKVYGHAKLSVRVRGGLVEEARLDVTENPRYFESLVVGKKADDVHDIMSRVCGICSSIHSITSIQAAEKALGIEVSETVRKLRELMVLGGYIQSHVTHLAFMALPDYLNQDTIFEAVPERKGFLKKMLSIKRTGNNLVRTVGGRAVHPLCPRVGGLTQLPSELELDMVASALKRHKTYAFELAELYAQFDYSVQRKTNYASLEKYGILGGNILVGDKTFTQEQYAQEIVEQLPNYGTAKFSALGGKRFAVGCLSRMNNCKAFLSDDAKELAKLFPSDSPYAHNLARAIEVIHFADSSLGLIAEVRPKLRHSPLLPQKSKGGRGVSVSEAPRGLLIHDYTFNEKGICMKANIITPTAQNLGNIEEDITALLPGFIEKAANATNGTAGNAAKSGNEKEAKAGAGKETEAKANKEAASATGAVETAGGSAQQKQSIVRDLEKLVRAYDPCLSCATHFLEVEFV